MRVFVSFVLLASLAVAPAISGCKRRPPQTPQPAPAPKVEQPAPAPPPPPPPKCETVEERCVAAATTLVTIGQSGHAFAPPAGWTYMHNDDLAAAFPDPHDAAIGFRAASGIDASADHAKAAPELAKFLETLAVTGLTADNLKRVLAKPPVVEPANGLQLKTWEVRGAKYKDQPAMLLAILVPINTSNALVGAVVVQNGAVESRAPAVRQSYLSLRSAQ